METVGKWQGTPLDAAARALERGRDCLDAGGRPAWIAATVVGFVLFWPIGLALLFFMIWSKRMFSNGLGCQNRKRWARRPEATGNVAFDAYRAETLKRLEEERDGFVQFLEQLRAAKDKAEFDEFMASRQKG